MRCPYTIFVRKSESERIIEAVVYREGKYENGRVLTRRM
jgi:hypothetical protein